MFREPNPYYQRYQVHTLLLLSTMLASAIFLAQCGNRDNPAEVYSVSRSVFMAHTHHLIPKARINSLKAKSREPTYKLQIGSRLPKSEIRTRT